MSNTVRTPGLFGRKPALFPAGLRDLTCYVAGSLPRAPASMAVPEVADWGMLGNDSKGDCGVAGLEHGFMAAAADAGEQESFASDQEAVSYYLTYTGGADTGVVLSQYLAYVRQHGYYSKTVKAYAPVEVHDVPTLQTAVWLYDFAYTGIEVTQQMQQDFAGGQPWTLDSLQSPIMGGHCVPIIGYDSAYLYAVTWGSIQPIAYSAWHYMSSEAWAIITGELVSKGGDGHGINLAALEADLSKLTD